MHSLTLSPTHLPHNMPKEIHMFLFYMHRKKMIQLLPYIELVLKTQLAFPMFATMGFSTFLCVFPFFFALSFFLQVEAAKKSIYNPQITVMGMVYCDICSNNSFSRHSYFLPGVEVRIDCMFKAISPRTTEQISFSVNRTTNKYGIYKLEVPSVDGVQCARDKAIVNSCRASLISSSSSSCDLPGFRTTSDEISVKSRQANFCIYSLNALSYRPSKRDIALCGK